MHENKIDAELEDKLHWLLSESENSGNKLIDVPRNFDTSEELKAFYDTFGYVSLKKLIPLDLIANVVGDLEEIFGPYSSNNDGPIDSAIINLDAEDKKTLYDLHELTSKLTSFSAFSSFISKTIKKISGHADPVFEIQNTYLLSIAKDQRLVYDFHQESNFMKGFDNIFNAHYPLLRTSTIENGTMSVLPASHHWGTLGYQKNRLARDSYTNLVPKKIDSFRNRLPELHCYLEVGDVVIFHKDLIHRSNFNGSELCRPVGVGRFTQAREGNWNGSDPESL